MKIIVACDSYKGCMTSAQVADNITAAIHRVDPAIEVVSYTMADGGEGTAAAFCDACGGEMVEAATTNAYGRRISAQYALIEEGKTAVIEAAGCIGLAMHPREKRNPLMASSFGVGTLMLDAQARGCRRIIVGLGSIHRSLILFHFPQNHIVCRFGIAKQMFFYLQNITTSVSGIFFTRL